MTADDAHKPSLPTAAAVVIVAVLLNHERVIALRGSIQLLAGLLAVGVAVLDGRRDGRNGRRRS